MDGSRGLLSALGSRRAIGIALLATTFGLSILLAVIQGAKKPPSQAVDAVIVILIAASQIGAAWVFSAEGKADPTLAERSVARLFHLAQRAGQAEARAQRAFESTSPSTALHAEMGMISTEFSWLEDGLIQAIGDWRVFHAQAVERAEGTNENDG